MKLARKILLVDDQKWALESMAGALRSHVGVEQVISVQDESGYREQMSNDVDVVIIDVELPSDSGADGVELARFTRQNFPGVKLLSMSFNTTSVILRKLFNEIGIDGFIDKNDSGLGTWALAVEVVMTGGIYSSPKIRRKVKRVLAIENLSDREVEVLAQIALGKKNYTISEELDIALKTVDNHRQNIYRKLKCNSTAEATSIYLKNRLLYHEEEGEMPNFRRFSI